MWHRRVAASRLLLWALLLLATHLPATHGAGSAGTCSAAALTAAHLAPAPLSAEDQERLARLLPQPTSDRPAVRAELRAPFHIPCQLRQFPHLKAFANEDKTGQRTLPALQVKEFAQPPHLLFFDRADEVVQLSSGNSCRYGAAWLVSE